MGGRCANNRPPTAVIIVQTTTQRRKQMLRHYVNNLSNYGLRKNVSTSRSISRCDLHATFKL